MGETSNSPRGFTLSGLNAALLLTLLGSWGGGAWYMATQAASYASMERRVAQLETNTSVGNRLDAADKRDENRAAAIGELATRMTRAESKLEFVGVNGGRR